MLNNILGKLFSKRSLEEPTYHIYVPQGFVRNAVRAHSTWVNWAYTRDISASMEFKNENDCTTFMRENGFKKHYAIVSVVKIVSGVER